MNTVTTLVLFAATALTGVLAGASLDQSIKQLPARHKIGPLTFSAYARAADLGNGILWYAPIGIGATLFTLIATVLILQGSANPQELNIAALAAGGLAIIHTLVTSQAAPIYYSQIKAANDEVALAAIFNRFEFRQTIRVIVQTTNFIVLLYVVYLFLIVAR